MYRTKMIMFVFIWLLIFQLHRVDATLTYVNTSCSNNNGNYLENSVYQTNLNFILSNLSSESSIVNFKNITVGSDTTKVYGLFQCRKDLSQDVCRDCIKAATQIAPQKCPFIHGAITWYYECMLRYENRQFFSFSDLNPSMDQWVTENSFSEFSHVVSDSLDGLIKEAVIGGSNFGHFAIREMNYNGPHKLYFLAQCTSDLGALECNNCLRAAFAEITTECPTGCIRAMTFLPSCHLRYDVSLFYNSTSVASLARSPSNGTKGKKLKTSIFVGIVVAAFAGLLVLVGGICLYRRNLIREVSNRKPAKVPRGMDYAENSGYVTFEGLGDAEFVQYDFATLQTATNNFSVDNKLGEGGFGVVYKGILRSGDEIAIKRLSGNSGQGENEFMTEAGIVAKLQHRNLVRMVGFCSEGDEKLLVYEFVPNASLDNFIFDPTKRPLLKWKTRYKIIMGIAKGVQYLHEDSRLTIIHRDLKAGNILLDEKMNPKIADFGTAKLSQGEENGGNTRRIVGTLGYMAPEYFLVGEYSNKSDVYSFGIIVLEIISGRKCRVYYQEDLPTIAWKLWNAGKSLELIDPSLDYSGSSSEVIRCIQIGMLCVQGNPEKRPTITEVVLMLTGSITLPLPLSPEMPSEQFNALKLDESVLTTINSVGWNTETELDMYPR